MARGLERAGRRGAPHCYDPTHLLHAAVLHKLKPSVFVQISEVSHCNIVLLWEEPHLPINLGMPLMFSDAPLLASFRRAVFNELVGGGLEDKRGTSSGKRAMCGWADHALHASGGHFSEPLQGS